jgi:hypothetical protein
MWIKYGIAHARLSSVVSGLWDLRRYDSLKRRSINNLDVASISAGDNAALGQKGERSTHRRQRHPNIIRDIGPIHGNVNFSRWLAPAIFELFEHL